MQYKDNPKKRKNLEGVKQFLGKGSSGVPAADMANRHHFRLIFPSFFDMNIVKLFYFINQKKMIQNFHKRIK